MHSSQYCIVQCTTSMGLSSMWCERGNGSQPTTTHVLICEASGDEQQKFEEAPPSYKPAAWGAMCESFRDVSHLRKQKMHLSPN